MVRVALVVVLASCNAFYGLDETQLGDPNNPYDPRDFDLDGETNFADNCPSLANEDRADRDGDEVGDVCDPHPDTPGDRIVERSFFAEPALDSERWDASNFVFEAGLVVDNDPSGTSMLRSKRSYEQRFLVVEVVFEATEWNTNPYVDGLTVMLDDIGGPSLSFRKHLQGMTCSVGGPGIDTAQTRFLPMIATRIPIRLRFVFDRETGLGACEVGGAKGFGQTTYALPSGPLYVLSEAMGVELYALVVYGID